MLQKITKLFQKNIVVKSLIIPTSGESAVSSPCNQIEWFNLKRLPALHKSSMKTQLHNKELISDIKLSPILSKLAAAPPSLKNPEVLGDRTQQVDSRNENIECQHFTFYVIFHFNFHFPLLSLFCFHFPLLFSSLIIFFKFFFFFRFFSFFVSFFFLSYHAFLSNQFTAGAQFREL